MIRKMRMERFWKRVREWADDNGHTYEPTYGIVDVAPM